MYTLQMEEVTVSAKAVVVPEGISFAGLRAARRIAAPGQVKPRWQVAAVEEYEESLQPLDSRLRRDMASRVLALTGHSVAPASIYVDAQARLAVTSVDGIVFKLLKDNLVVLRSCVHCNCCQFASMPITNRAELGYMLTEWEPRCATCQPEDSDYWIYCD